MPTFVTKRIKSLDLNGKPRKESHYAGFTSLHVKTSALILPFPFVSATSAQ